LRQGLERRTEFEVERRSRVQDHLQTGGVLDDLLKGVLASNVWHDRDCQSARFCLRRVRRADLGRFGLTAHRCHHCVALSEELVEDMG
jgi:hypothetical protein